MKTFFTFIGLKLPEVLLLLAGCVVVGVMVIVLALSQRCLSETDIISTL